ncbi:MAG: hypothetical protein WDA75_10855 [Candidatus Latescibacterota bacterium]|jgi:hypothetical protein
MGRRELILGVPLVVVIAAGVYWASHRGASEILAGGAGSTLAGSAIDLPDLSRGDARLEVDGLIVRVEGTRPIRAFEQNRLLFRFEGPDGSDRPVAEAVVSFTMTMEMGKHRYSLVPAAREGWLQAELVLPACPSGNRRWYGDLTFTSAGRPGATRFQFDLEPRPD